MTSLAAGPLGDLISNIAAALAKDGVEQATSTVAGLVGTEQLDEARSLEETLAASGELPPASQSAWSLGWSARGLQIEQDLGGDLPPGFPTIDKFDNGIATSIKSIDLAAPTYQSESALASRLRGYVNRVANFDGATRSGVAVDADQIKGRVLEVAIPEGSPTAAQQAALDAADQYGATRGVSVKVIPVP